MGDIVAIVLKKIPQLKLLIRDDVAGNLCAMAFSEGLIMSLDPDCDLVKVSLPYFIRYKGWSSARQILDWGYIDEAKKSAEGAASAAVAAVQPPAGKPAAL